MANQPLTLDSLKETLDEVRTLLDGLKADMGEVQKETQSKLDSMQAQILDVAGMVETIKARGTLSADDVRAAMEDMQSIKDRLIAHLRVVQTWSAPDVGIACYMFYFMIEVAWTMLFCAASGQRLEPLSKAAVTPCSFKVPVRATFDKKYDLPPPLKGLAAGTRSKLVDLLTQWSPHYFKEQQGTITIKYNKVAYWLHALRLVRDVGTHRSLALVERPPPGSTDVLKVKLPISPAASEPQPLHSHQNLPAFGNDALSFQAGVSNIGYSLAPIDQMASEIEAVTHVVCDGLSAVLSDVRNDILKSCPP